MTAWLCVACTEVVSPSSPLTEDAAVFKDLWWRVDNSFTDLGICKILNKNTNYQITNTIFKFLKSVAQSSYLLYFEILYKFSEFLLFPFFNNGLLLNILCWWKDYSPALQILVDIGFAC